MAQANGFFYAGVSLRFGTKVLLLRNVQRDVWELPGGKVDSTDKTYLEAAIREFREETGLALTGAPEWLMGVAPAELSPHPGLIFGFNIDRTDLPPTPTLSDEHNTYAWFELDNLPEDLHPACRHAILRWTYNENDLYKLIESGILLGPNTYFNQVLFPVRITGVGIAFRMGKMQYTFRDPGDYLTEDFVQRCNGLQLLWEHAEGDLTDDKTVAEQGIGTVVNPFIRGQEVWGVGRVISLEAASMMATGAFSTSPSFITKIDASTTSGGVEFTVEGQVQHLDHLAVVDMGVWDKLGDASGVETPVTLRPIPLSFLKEFTMSQSAADSLKEDAADMHNDAAEPNKDAAVEAHHEDRFKSLEDSVMSLRDSIAKISDALMPRKDAAVEHEADSATKEEPKKEEPAKDGLQATPAVSPLNKNASFGDEAPLPGESAINDGEAAMTPEALKHALAAKDALIGTLQKKVDALASSMPKDLSDEDRNELASAEAKADSVFMALGKTAPHPLMNENHMPYRRRVAKTLQPYSTRFKDVNLSALDQTSFGAIESEIYKDAMIAARSPINVPAGGLVPVKRKAFGGREIIEYRGAAKAFLGPYSENAKRAKARHTTH